MLQKTSLDDLLARYADKGRESLLSVLWDIQTRDGYIGHEAVHAISHTLRVPEADIYGVISFYTLFFAEPTAQTICHVCTSPVCTAKGARATSDALTDSLGTSVGENTADGAYRIEHTECLGLCDHAPAVMVQERGTGVSLHGDVTADVATDFLAAPDKFGYATDASSQLDVLLNAEYDPYAVVRDVLKKALAPAEIIAQVRDAGLIGRGGAAFPTALKWELAAREPEPTKYIVCNADESEPGTFKDRYLMEHHPQQVLAGMILAAYAVGATHGYVFVRGEYAASTERLQREIDALHSHKLLGSEILGTGFSFDLTLSRGAGAYICGEETALFEAIEGKRGFPRIKPPYPTVSGLFGKPTVVNNVETLAIVPHIIERGADWFKSIGTEKSAGPKLVSVSGDVKRAGVYEITPGITLRTFLDDLCGGVEGELQAVLMGGAAGTFLTPDDIDVPLTFENLQAIGSTFGSGAIMVFNQDVDLGGVLKSVSHFFRHESCGKCFPCQLGTQRQHELVTRVFDSGPTSLHIDALQDIGITMTDSSICGLGQTAGSAVLSAIEKFPHLFDTANGE